MQPVLHTERLHMRPVTLDDGEAFHLIWGDPEVIWWGHRNSIDDTREFMRNLTAVSPLGRDDIGWWLLLERATGDVIGDAVLQPVPRLPLEIEIGWHLVRSHWGRGYATEAAGRLLEYAIGRPDLDVIIADIAFTNNRSISVAERLGMTPRPDPIERGGIPHGVWEIRAAV
ncbi:MAG: GNAT family N-acetyltransferase [Acidimicrobiia bacterium]|nr:GNAT family N-acetyltransferase [Acidimicrobiia bacterium]